jgi:hypothetical protein
VATSFDLPSHHQAILNHIIIVKILGSQKCALVLNVPILLWFKMAWWWLCTSKLVATLIYWTINCYVLTDLTVEYWKCLCWLLLEKYSFPTKSTLQRHFEVLVLGCVITSSLFCCCVFKNIYVIFVTTIRHWFEVTKDALFFCMLAARNSVTERFFCACL